MNTTNWYSRVQKADLRVRNFLNGHYVEKNGEAKTNAEGRQHIKKLSPRDGSLLYQFDVGCAEDINLAVNNARQAFNDGRWRDISIYQRQSILFKLADLVEKHKEEFALYECLDVGKPLVNAINDDVPSAIDQLRSSAQLADKLMAPAVADGAHFSYRLRKPIGVVGAIVGWNYPLSLAAAKVGPALVMGNSLVLKPSEFSSLSASRLAELALEAGVPPGVFNVVHGSGATVGSALAHHADVDLLVFVGSSATGKEILTASGKSNMKRLVLECGGKSPYLIFDDCSDNLDSIANDVVARAFANQGALCVASTRILIHENIKEKLLTKIIEKAEQLKPEDPLNMQTKFGAIINESQLNKILGYIQIGKSQGAKLVCGGNRIAGSVDNDLSKGYYVEPTIFTDVKPQHKIAREEIFGPVLSVFSFGDEEEAINLANDSSFGLAAYVATTSLGRAHRLSQKLNSGSITITGSLSSQAGGVYLCNEPHKESGFGVKGGLPGLESYTASSSVYIQI